MAGVFAARTCRQAPVAPAACARFRSAASVAWLRPMRRWPGSVTTHWMQASFSWMPQNATEPMSPLSPRASAKKAGTAITSCCAQTGGKCKPDPTIFQADSWSALNFSVDDPFYYSYQYTGSSGVDTSATFQAWAFGDLDCDTIYATYMRGGSVMTDRSVSGGSGLYSKNEIE